MPVGELHSSVVLHTLAAPFRLRHAITIAEFFLFFNPPGPCSALSNASRNQNKFKKNTPPPLPVAEPVDKVSRALEAIQVSRLRMTKSEELRTYRILRLRCARERRQRYLQR